MYFKNVNCDFDINIRDHEYGDFRDWFMIDEKPKVHHTKFKMLINNELIGEVIFPINTKTIKCKVSGEVDNSTVLNNYTYMVPEMGIKIHKPFKNPTSIEPGDRFDVTADFSIFGDD